MKISFIEPHLQIYGGIRRILELANRLTQRGHDVTIYHSDGSPCEWMACNAKIKRAEDVLNEEHDVLIYNDPTLIDYKLARRANARLKVFYVLGLYVMSLLKGSSPRIYLPQYKRTLFLRKSLKSPYLILSNASWLVHWLKENLNIDSQLLIGGVNREIFHPIDVEKNRDEIRILYSGDQRRGKGSQTVYEAMEIVKKEVPNIVLETYFNKGISQEYMAEVYSRADIFIDAQWQAGWNNPVAEAMACKTAVVCTDIGGVKDFAFHEKTALVVPPKDPEAMAEAILRLVRDETLRVRLEENAFHHICQFDWEKSADRLENILTFELDKSHFMPSYTGERYDIQRLIPDNVRKVLDIGCSTGALGESIKRRNAVEVIGIEMNKIMAEIARKKLDQVIIGDMEKIKLEKYFLDNYFDCIIFADILEHLKDPWSILKQSTRFLAKGGVIVASIPNARHYTTIISLTFKGYWPYRDRGIHDRTHIRFFTIKNIKEMFNDANLNIVTLERNYRIIESPNRYNKISKYLGFYPFRDFLAFQYLIVAMKSQ